MGQIINPLRNLEAAGSSPALGAFCHDPGRYRHLLCNRYVAIASGFILAY